MGGKKTDDKKPGMTDEQKRQANCKAMEGMAAKMTATGVDLSADPSKIGKEKVDALCKVFKHFPKEKAGQFAKCSTKNQLLVAGARKICTAGDKNTDDKKKDDKNTDDKKTDDKKKDDDKSTDGKKTDDKKPGMTDEQKRQANCKAMEGM